MAGSGHVLYGRSGRRALFTARRSPSKRHMSATAPAPEAGSVATERDTVVRALRARLHLAVHPGVCAAAPVTGCRSSEWEVGPCHRKWSTSLCMPARSASAAWC